jgi:acyl carrier protein
MTTDEALAALSALADAPSNQAIAARIDPRRFPSGSLTASRSASRGPTVEAASLAPEPNVRRELEAAPPRSRRALLESHLQRQAASVLGFKPDHRFDTSRPLNDLGLDSLLAVRLANALSATLGVLFSSTLLFDYPTIDSLVDHIGEKVLPVENDSVDAAPLATESQRASGHNVHGLSEADAASLLLEELESIRKPKQTS